MAKYKVLVTARSFGTADSKALELLEANDCEVKKLVAADGPIPEQLKKELPEADASSPAWRTMMRHSSPAARSSRSFPAMAWDMIR